jgi:Rgg/GadR/MutR family transcriptional activator
LTKLSIYGTIADKLCVCFCSYFLYQKGGIDLEIEEIQEGTFYRDKRVARGFHQTDVLDEMITASSLSRFECGKTQLKAETLFHIIEKIGMTPSEYDNARRGYQLNRMEQLYDNLNHIMFLGKAGLAKSEKFIIPQPKDKFEKLSNIMIKAVLEDVTGKSYISSKDRKTVINYLDRIDYWSEFEMKLLYYARFILETGDLWEFGELLIERTQHFYQGEIKRLFLATLSSLYGLLLERQALREASYFRTFLEERVTQKEIEVFICFNIRRLAHDYLLDKNEKNLTQIEDYLNKIEVIGVTVLVEFYREWIKKL